MPVAPPKETLSPAEARKLYRRIATQLAEAHDADVLVYNGPIKRPHDEEVLDSCNARRRRKNVLLMLTTSGGDAHAAYRIARALQRSYEKFIAFIPGYCKSAGTLLVLGAHELILSHHAELGPLDAQVIRGDEVGERSSGLTPADALTSLNMHAADAFGESFASMRFKLQMSTRLAAEMAAELVGRMYSDVFSQVDPMRLGELDRANRIAIEYGQRLIEHSKNAPKAILGKLVAGYPSHGFVIDREEAETIFTNVRAPELIEQILASRSPFSEESAVVEFISDEPPKPPENATGAESPGVASQSEEEQTNGSESQDLGRAEGSHPAEPAPNGATPRSATGGAHDEQPSPSGRRLAGEHPGSEQPAPAAQSEDA